LLQKRIDELTEAGETLGMNLPYIDYYPSKTGNNRVPLVLSIECKSYIISSHA
jgi:hypothetical protein